MHPLIAYGIFGNALYIASDLSRTYPKLLGRLGSIKQSTSRCKREKSLFHVHSFKKID
jgi:hypothetical protein